MRIHKEIEAIVKRKRSMEEPPPLYQQTKQSTLPWLGSTLFYWRSTMFQMVPMLTISGIISGVRVNTRNNDRKNRPNNSKWLNKNWEDFHDKKEEMTKMKWHEELETIMKQMRSMEELPSSCQITKQSTWPQLYQTTPSIKYTTSRWRTSMI